MDQQERAAFEKMDSLEQVLGAGFLLAVDDFEKSKAKADESEGTK
jgi:hypothetical protein